MKIARVLLTIAAALLASCQRAPAPERVPVVSAARRVVTLAPSLTEVVLAVGAGDRLVGVTRFDDAPEVASLPRVGGYNDPSPETILRLRPDLVLAQPSPGNRAAVELLQRSGVTVEVLELERLADIRKAIEQVGTRLDHAAQAQEVVTRVEAALERTRAAARRRGDRTRVALLVGLQPLVAAGPDTFVGELLREAGAENVVPSGPQPWPMLPLESLLAMRAERLMVAPMGESESAIASLPGPLRERTHVVRSQGFLRPGPRVVEALDELTALLDGRSTEPGTAR